MSPPADSKAKKFRIWSSRGTWAVFKHERPHLQPEEFYVPVRFFREMPDGDLIGLVLDRRGMIPATDFPNFLRYEDRGRLRK